MPELLGDSEFYFYIRNHEWTRFNARNQDIVPIEVHEDWFSKSLQNKERSMYVAEDDCLEGDKRVGHIRFDLESYTEAEISIFVHPDFQSRGYGREILEEGMKR